jgi:15-cis-phytoene synthase
MALAPHRERIMPSSLLQAWERPLLVWADQARATTPQRAAHSADRHRLARSYEICAAITRHHSRTFYLASSLLPAGKRDAVRALYAFCRICDNIVDKPGDDPAELLEQWRIRVQTPHPTDDPVLIAWADARERFHIPAGFVDQLISGVKRDLTQSRYPTFGELAEYAYGVASTVGLMSMHIIGFEGDSAVPYAVRLGVALQLTNILRDVGEDFRAGRIYLPADELARFGLSDGDLRAGLVDDRWREFMRFQIERNRALYAESWPGVQFLYTDGRFAIAAAGRLYEAILDDIERADYDVFSRRAYVSTSGKIARLPRIWWSSRRTAGV